MWAAPALRRVRRTSLLSSRMRSRGEIACLEKVKNDQPLILLWFCRTFSVQTLLKRTKRKEMVREVLQNNIFTSLNQLNVILALANRSCFFSNIFISFIFDHFVLMQVMKIFSEGSYCCGSTTQPAWLVFLPLMGVANMSTSNALCVKLYPWTCIHLFSIYFPTSRCHYIRVLKTSDFARSLSLFKQNMEAKTIWHTRPKRKMGQNDFQKHQIIWPGMNIALINL